MKSLVRLILFFILLLGCESVSQACSFDGFPDPPLRYRIVKTNTIYIGEVLKNTTSDQKIKGEEYIVQNITFNIVKALKGIDGSTTEINLYEKVKKNPCIDFKQRTPKIGELWLVRIEGKELNWPNFGGIYSPSVFTYDSLKNSEYLSKLESIIRNPAAAIYGQLHEAYSLKPVVGLKVAAESHGKSLTTTTDKEGRYSFENVVPGTYKIRIHLPFYASDRWNYTDISFDGEDYSLEYLCEIKKDDAQYRYFVLSFASD